MTSHFEPRIATDDDFGQLTTLIPSAFLDDREDDEVDLYRMVFEPERTHVIEDEGRLVATGGVFSRELTVPGGVIPAAHVTAVAVAATHRRRGLLTSIMGSMLSAVVDRGDEPIAALWASEGAIYGRFGYGLASWSMQYDIQTRETQVGGAPSAGGRLRQAVPREVADQLVEVFDRVRAVRPGLSSRPGRWWERRLADPKSWRGGMSAERAVLYEQDGELLGYARYRTKSGWNTTGPDGEVKVLEALAETPEAYAALWRYLLSIDLVRSVTYGFAAVDDPLPHLVTNADAVGSSRGPALWVRVVDVPAALSARRYAAPIDVVLEVSDAAFSRNAGRWRLVGDGASVDCAPTQAKPDLALDVRELGSLYLGGVSAGSLAAGGLIDERTPGAAAALSAAFGWHRAPVVVEIF